VEEEPHYGPWHRFPQLASHRRAKLAAFPPGFLYTCKCSRSAALLVEIHGCAGLFPNMLYRERANGGFQVAEVMDMQQNS
jgi:hypothetical protein